MASRGYYFDFVDGERYAVPSPGVLLCPVRGLTSGYPDWLVEFTRGDLFYFRRFGDYPTYSLEKLGDGTFELRDVDVDTVMYTMTPVYDSAGNFEKYSVVWAEHLSESYPEECEYQDDFLLPTTEDGDEWGEFRAEFNYLVFPVYHLNYTTLDDEDVVEYECRYLLDLYYESENLYGCTLWNRSTKAADVEFQFDRGEYDTQGRRIYPLRWVDCSVLFDDDGFVLHDDAGDRVGNAVRYVHEDDEGFNDGWGMDSLSSLAFETYLEWFSNEDNQYRSYSTDLQREVWDASVEAEENPLDKLARIIRMPLDAKLNQYTWQIEIPANHMRMVESTDLEIRKTRVGWSVYDGSELKYTVENDDTSWNFYGTDGTLRGVLGPVGNGTFDFASADGTVHYVVHAQEALSDFEPNGEYSKENIYPPLHVTNESGEVVYEIGRPERMTDPFEELTFAEFVDDIPLRLVDGAWTTYAGTPKWYVGQSDNVNFWRDIYDRRNNLAYRISKPSEWDEDDREVYSVDETKVATMSLLSLTSDKTGDEVAKLYADPAARYTYQLFDNDSGAYNYLTRYENDLVVVVNQKGNVVCYVTPSGEYRGPTWYLFGTVGDGEVYDTDGNVIYTFRKWSGDYNIYDADENVVGHLFSATTPNNDWVIGEGCQRLFTFLAEESKVLIDSNYGYTFRTKDGSTVISSSLKVQADEMGRLLLVVYDEEGTEIYRVANSGTTYQIDASNGVAFDTANSYDTYSQGNMVLTRYWSVPYDRMMYSCTNDQPEGAFDDIFGGTGDSDGAGASPARASLVGVSYRSVSGSGSGVLGDAGSPKTFAVTSTSEGTSESSGGAMSSPDTIQDLLDTMSDYYDSVNGILSKDTNTSKGDDLDPDNPLQMSHAETDGRQLANAAFADLSSLTVTEKHALSDAYDYTQAITRVSKMYSLGRADIYQEAQDYAATRTKRIEAKKAQFTQVMEKSKERAQKEQG